MTVGRAGLAAVPRIAYQSGGIRERFARPRAGQSSDRTHTRAVRLITGVGLTGPDRLRLRISCQREVAVMKAAYRLRLAVPLAVMASLGSAPAAQAGIPGAGGFSSLCGAWTALTRPPSLM